MVGERAVPRLPWANKFRQPTPEQLVTQCATKQLGQLVEAARREISVFQGVTETLCWQGVPWRWTFVYTVAARGGSPEAPAAHAALRAHPLAYIIPDPQRPQVAVPLSERFVEGLPVKRLKRFVRDGIVHSRLVGEVHWSCWDFSARSQLDEIMDLVSRKYKAFCASVQPVAGGV